MTDLMKLTAKDLMGELFEEIRRRLEQLEEREQQWLTQRVAIDAMVLQAGHPSQFGVEFRLVIDYLLRRLEQYEAALKRYANKANWRRSRSDGRPVDEWICCDEEAWNGPDAARAALEEK